MRGFMRSIAACAALVLVANVASAEMYQLVTGVGMDTSPGAVRTVVPSSFPGAGVPGQFDDGQRLGGTPGAAPTAYAGTGTPMFSTNQFGSLSFMFRRGSVGIPGVGQAPVLAVDYLGGPLLDLDGDLGNGMRSLTPVAGATPVAIPGSAGFVDLGFDLGAGTVALNNFDTTSNNAGFQGFGPDIAVTVNTIAGTQPDGTLTGPINPSVDTRLGTVTDTGTANVLRIEGLGYEFWQDSIGASSTAADLGTLQYLGTLDGYRIIRGEDGEFPTLAGLLGTTRWPAVETAGVGGTHATATGVASFATITDGVAGDVFSFPGNGGLALTDFGGDLGAYLDAVVVPNIDPLSESFVYLTSAGVGINNSFDPVFGDTNGYDVVLIAQSLPIPEPQALALLAVGGLLSAARRRRA